MEYGFPGPPHKHIRTVAMLTHGHDTIINMVSKWTLLNQDSENMHNSNHLKCNLISSLM